FAYELMGAAPPAALAGPAASSAGRPPAEPAAVHSRRRHDGAMAPVSLMLGSHVTQRETGDGVS
ncbi:MAG TPA: hypothetical protein VEQ16_01710, partial [Acidocella sp.]|nr:hypothetical protein [Acidocella sp.]